MIRQPPKKHRARIQILHSGRDGITENEILFNCRLSSGRNYLTELERELRFRFERKQDKNPDGIGTHTRYAIPCREDAEKVINLVNSKARLRGYDGISAGEVIAILSLYPPKENAQPKPSV